ncbi:MAG: dihydroneopterin aldolase [Cyclobacteriaceae bacterium]|nr:dihydroneopterin aldolase [Cyclobacteriaceae bacterium]
MAIISLEGLEFFAYHGVHEFEKEQGNSFIVDVEVEVDVSEAEKTDELSGTIDYEVLFKLVSAEMEVRSKLLEHVSSRICDSILKNWLQIQHVKVKIGKMNPPIGAVCKMSGVTVTRSR